jgi:hypothetical protein
MAENRDPVQQDQLPRGWLDTISERRQQAAYVLFAVALLLGIGTIWFFVMARDEAHQWEYIWLAVWLGFLGLLALGAGLWQFLYEPAGTPGDVDATRLLVLTVGGVAGLLTVLLSLALTYQWRDTLSEGLEGWRRDWWRLALCLLALLCGLAVMFISLQLARTRERSSAWMRRLLYGYNAVLTGLLLLAILGVFNVLTYVRLWPFTYFSNTTDWTTSSIYSLSPASRNLLAALDKPVKIYALMPNAFAQSEFKTLMDNVRAVTNSVEVEYLSPDLSPRRVAELRKKYHFLEGVGVLLTYGTEPHEAHDFIKIEDIFVENPQTNGFQFNGEDALITHLSALEQGKSKAVVYFTQGNGELDLNDTGETRDSGVGVLKSRLQQANYEVKPLKLDATLEKVPDDAVAVIVARPTLPGFPTKALDAYMNSPGKGKKNGKLIVLLDVNTTPGRTRGQTGLEAFLRRFNVRARMDQIVCRRFPEDPLQVLATPNPTMTHENPIARAFRDEIIDLYRVRTVEPLPVGERAPDSRYSPDTLLLAVPPVWSETDLRADPAALLKALSRPDRRQELFDKEREGPLPVAVAVTSPRGPSAAMDPHAMMREEPRMVVFGDATWVTNPYVREGSGSLSYVFFASTLSWLRERPDIGATADPKERKIFTLNVKPEVASRLTWLPLVWMLIGILGVGGGIWVVRRR